MEHATDSGNRETASEPSFGERPRYAVRPLESLAPRDNYATWLMGLFAALLIVGIEIAILAVPERGPAPRSDAQVPRQMP